MVDDAHLGFLLDVREGECASARLALSHAVADLAETTARLEHCHKQLRRLEGLLDSARRSDEVTDVRGLKQSEEYLRALEMEIHAARQDLTDSYVVVKEAERVVREYQQDLERAEGALSATRGRLAVQLAEAERRRASAEADADDEDAAARWHRHRGD